MTEITEETNVQHTPPEMIEAKNALVAAWLNLWGKGYVVRNCYVKGSLNFHHTLPVQVRAHAKKGWIVYIGDKPRKRISIAVRHPLGNAQEGKWLHMSAKNADRDLRWTKAFLAAFVHPEMIDASYYTSQSGMTVRLADWSGYKKDQVDDFGYYSIDVRWQNERQIWVSKSFYLSADFEVIRVELSGKCPVCRYPIDDVSNCRVGGIFGTHGLIPDKILNLPCPECKTALTTHVWRDRPAEPESIFWFRDWRQKLRTLDNGSKSAEGQPSDG